MTTLSPDELSAQRLAGIAPRPAGAKDKHLGDGTLVEDPAVRPDLVLRDRSLGEVTEIVCGYCEKSPGVWWLPLFLGAASVTGLLFLSLTYLITTGVGTWGLNNQVDWAWDITNFVFWIGIGHAGTLISAILCLLKQKWRTAVNRSAEAMTIFAVMCAGIFPGVHVGRVWFIWMIFPIPNYNWIWPNFQSPLLWDVFAVSTYATVSALFWFMGLIPDFATLRDRAILRMMASTDAGKRRQIPDMLRAYIFGLLSFGWRNSSRHWHRYEMAYLLLAGLSTPLVLSVHSIVSFDFATSQLPGWHTTIFPPYFVAGAVFGGFAMVLFLLVPLRELLPNMKDFLTDRHLEGMAKILLLTGTMVGFAYAMEFFIAWYGGNEYELHAFLYNRVLPTWIHPDGAPYWWAYWTMISCNVISPQLFWFKKLRTNPLVIWIVALAVTIGMWFERFVIIVTSLHRAWLPGEWHMFWPTPVDIGVFVGSCGMFLTLFLLFVRFLPIFPIAELKAVMPAGDPHGHRGLPGVGGAHAGGHHGESAGHGDAAMQTEQAGDDASHASGSKGDRS